MQPCFSRHLRAAALSSSTPPRLPAAVPAVLNKDARLSISRDCLVKTACVHGYPSPNADDRPGAHDPSKGIDSSSRRGSLEEPRAADITSSSSTAAATGDSGQPSQAELEAAAEKAKAAVEAAAAEAEAKALAKAEAKAAERAAAAASAHEADDDETDEVGSQRTHC